MPTTVDAKSILTATLYLLLEQFKLDDNYHAYLEGIRISNKNLRTGIKKTPLKNAYKIVTGAQWRKMIVASNKQFSFLEISLVFKL